MSSTTEKIKDRLDIVDVVSSYIKLEKAGKNFKARCPFHNEKTPSFIVSPDRGTYYCFGCNRGGDIFTFVQEFEGLDFMGALKVLADRAGIPIEYARGETKGKHDRLFALMEETVVFFEKNLTTSKEAQEYIEKRGITTKTSAQFQLGYAQDDWRTLHTYLSSKGYADAEMLLAGVVKKNEAGKLYDTFRHRIIFPIFDSSTRVVACAGRALRADDPAKYLNSPETPLFHKSKILYGFETAKQSIRKYDFSILVEGPIDLVLSHQAGFSNTVAIQGTALTVQHITKLSRLSTNIVFALDGDTAGISSLERSAKLALAVGMDTKVAVLKEGDDPADMIVRNPDEWKQSVRHARHVIDVLLEQCESEKDDARAFKLATRKRVLPLIACIPNAIDQAHFIQKVATVLDVPSEAITEEVSKIDREKEAPELSPKETPEATQQMPSEISRTTELYKKLNGVILWQASLSEPTLETQHIVETFQELFGDSPPDDGTDDSEQRIFEAEMTLSGSEHPEQHINEMLLQLKEDFYKTHLAEKMNQLKAAERAHKTEEALQIMKECADISKHIESLKHLYK